MSRPAKWRRIEVECGCRNYGPIGKNRVSTTDLLLEEIEAIRLKDLEKLDQNECAEKMQVSRPTFQRILTNARYKIADSLVNQKGIHISGGNYTKQICAFKCMKCGKEWTESFENVQKINSSEYKCPSCESSDIICMNNCRNGMKKFCHMQGRGIKE
ncbi:MAG: DUF134 domain-containing protein [Bacilli bacterium]